MKPFKDSKKVLVVGLVASMGLVGCSSSGGGAGAADKGGTPKPDVKCDIAKGNLDASKIDTSKAKGQITFMTQNLKKDFTPFFTKLIAKFEKENPGTKIVWQDRPGGPDFDKLMMADAVNCQMADVVNIPQQTLLALSKPNLLLNLDAKAPGIGSKYLKTFWDGAAVGYKNHHTGLPWYSIASVTTFNRDVFKRNGLDVNNPPKSMRERFAMGEKIVKSGSHDFALYGNANWYLFPQLLSMGAKLMNDDHTKFTFANDPNALEWVTQMAKLYKEGAVPRDSLTGEPDANKAYFEGNLAIGTPNPSFLRALKKNNPAVYKVTDIGPAPHKAGVKPPVGSQYIALSATTKNAPLALKFAEFLTNAEEEYAWAHDGGAVIFPPATKALDKIEKNPPAFGTDALFKKAYAQSAKDIRAGKMYISESYINGSVQKALVDNINKGVRGEVSPKQALKNAQDAMNKLLERMNG